jgi:thiamine kinase-like enzyme
LSRAADWVYPYLERLPQTLLHHDVWLPNLGRREAQTVLIDWSYVGPGTPGADLSQTFALLTQMWSADIDDTPLLEALYTGLTEDWQLPLSYDQYLAGYEITFCLRPAHALAGPVLGGILSGRQLMVGSTSLEERLGSAEVVLQRIERGLQRLREG